jgi:hypothetical protein
MNLKYLFLLFVIAALVACSPEQTPETENVTDATGAPVTAPTAQREYALSVTYEGGFVPAGQGPNVLSASGDTLTYANYGADGTIQRIQERTLTPDEQEGLESILDDVGELQSSYGDGTGMAADAGYATITIMTPDGTMTTIVDPNTEETYPEELDALMDWVREQTAAFSDDETLTACTDPRPENCIQIYDPVCGDNGRTYSNACVACADQNVSSFGPGEC